LLYRLTDRLPVRATFLVAIQHVLAMFVGVITVPLLVAHSLKLPRDETDYLISMGLVASGLGTMVQVRGIGFFGSRLLAVQGTSFAFLVPLIQAGQAGGLALMLGMSLLCAPVELVLALFLTRLQRLFTPLVSGTVVLLIGLSLIPIGFKTMAAGLGGHSPAWGRVSRCRIGRDDSFWPEYDPFTLDTNRRDPNRARDWVLVVFRARGFAGRHERSRARLGDSAPTTKVWPQCSLGIPARVLLALRAHNVGNARRRDRYFSVVR
jgi:hypothetical protein